MWLEKNPWFLSGRYPDAAKIAIQLDKILQSEGFKPDNPAMYTELNRRLKVAMPNLTLGEVDIPTAKQPTSVTEVSLSPPEISMESKNSAPLPIMTIDGLFSMFLNLLTYISIPVIIRYVILRRPIEKKRTAIAILIPIFIGFSILISMQRKEIYRQYNVPYEAINHMIGSPLLYGAMVFSYYTLVGVRRKKAKPINSTANNST